jgi:hypothetical protein
MQIIHNHARSRIFSNVFLSDFSSAAGRPHHSGRTLPYSFEPLGRLKVPLFRVEYPRLFLLQFLDPVSLAVDLLLQG